MLQGKIRVVTFQLNMNHKVEKMQPSVISVRKKFKDRIDHNGMSRASKGKVSPVKSRTSSPRSVVFPFHTSYKSGQISCKMYNLKNSLDTVRIKIYFVSAKCIFKIRGFVFCFSAALEAHIAPVDGSKCTTAIMENASDF